jgi:hypothetical protein
MNPSRLAQLYSARFPNGVPNGVRSGHPSGYPAQAAALPAGTRYVDLSPRPDNEDDGTLLAAYFLGGE